MSELIECGARRLIATLLLSSSPGGGTIGRTDPVVSGMGVGGGLRMVKGVAVRLWTWGGL